MDKMCAQKKRKRKLCNVKVVDDANFLSLEEESQPGIRRGGEEVGRSGKKKRKWIKMVDLSKNAGNSWTKLLAKNGKSS